MFSALVPIAHVCRGNIATNAIAIGVPSVRWAADAFPEFPNSAYPRLAEPRDCLITPGREPAMTADPSPKICWYLCWYKYFFLENIPSISMCYYLNADPSSATTDRKLASADRQDHDRLATLPLAHSGRFPPLFTLCRGSCAFAPALETLWNHLQESIV